MRRTLHRQPFGATLAAAIALAAPPAPAQMPGAPTIFHETAEVRVVEVDVWVSDAAGRPVRDLTREEFRLSVDEREVEIRHVAYRGGEGTDGEEAPPLSLLVLIDNDNLAADNRDRAISRLRALLEESWPPGLRVLLASHDGGLVFHRPLTSDRSQILAALTDLSTLPTRSARFEREHRNLLAEIDGSRVEEERGFTMIEESRRALTASGDDLMGGRSIAEDVPEGQGSLTDRGAGEARLMVSRIRSYSAERLADVERTLGVLDRLVDAAAGLPGRKAILYVTDGWPLRPGEELWDAFSRRFGSLGRVSSRLAVAAEAAHHDASARLAEVVDDAASSEVAIYPLLAAPGSGRGRGAGGARGAAAGDFDSWSDAVAGLAENNLLRPLARLAEGTGGRAGFGPATFDLVLEGALADAEGYYSLGYEPAISTEAATGPYEIAVRVSRRDLLVRHRAGLRYPTVEQQMDDAVLSALLGGDPGNPLQMELETRPAVATLAADELLVPILVKIPIDRLVLLPSGTEHLARLSMAIAVRDQAGRASNVTHNPCPIRISNSEILEALGRSVTCGIRLALRPGEQYVAVTVRDGLAAVQSTVAKALKLAPEAEEAAEPPESG